MNNRLGRYSWDELDVVLKKVTHRIGADREWYESERYVDIGCIDNGLDLFFEVYWDRANGELLFLDHDCPSQPLGLDNLVTEEPDNIQSLFESLRSLADSPAEADGYDVFELIRKTNNAIARRLERE